MPTVRRNPIAAFYRALSPLGRWPRWLFLGILLYSLVVMLAVIGYGLTGPSSGALSVAIDNILFLWAVGFVPAAILMLLLLGRARPQVWRSWSGRLLFAGMIGLLISFLVGFESINTIFLAPVPPAAWTTAFLTASADVLVIGLILLPWTSWRRWSTWIWVAGMIAFIVSASFQALAAVVSAFHVDVLIQVANATRSVSYWFIIVGTVTGLMQSRTILPSRHQDTMNPPPG